MIQQYSDNEALHYINKRLEVVIGLLVVSCLIVR